MYSNIDYQLSESKDILTIAVDEDNELQYDFAYATIMIKVFDANGDERIVVVEQWDNGNDKYYRSGIVITADNYDSWRSSPWSREVGNLAEPLHICITALTPVAEEALNDIVLEANGETNNTTSVNLQIPLEQVNGSVRTASIVFEDLIREATEEENVGTSLYDLTLSARLENNLLDTLVF